MIFTVQMIAGAGTSWSGPVMSSPARNLFCSWCMPISALIFHFFSFIIFMFYALFMCVYKHVYLGVSSLI